MPTRTAVAVESQWRLLIISSVDGVSYRRCEAPIHTFTAVIGSPEEFKELNPSDGTCLIKPNFFTQCEGYYTDVRALDLFLAAIPGRKIVIESYTTARTDRSRSLQPGRAREHIEWEQDRAFFADTGIGECLENIKRSS